MVCLCPFRQQLEKDGQLPAQHQHKGQQAHLFNVRHLPLSESTVGGRKKRFTEQQLDPWASLVIYKMICELPFAPTLQPGELKHSELLPKISDFIE